MPFIEAPTTFYLGRRYDPATHRLSDEVVYYDSRDLTTHAVVVGMTGSGKTGLCISLLEEAALDEIPAIVIDPKGDITNLLLAFPDLRPEDFEPWVNVADARRAGLEVDLYAADVAQKWRDGLASWHISGQRIASFKNKARFSIYTPGSDAGLPVSILDAMQAPRGGWLPGDDEFHRERISGITTALLALVGRNVEPVRDREHVLISNIFEHAWRQGQDLTLEDVIIQVQKPPFAKLGVFDIDTFFPEKDRFKLAMELNNIIASPSFQSWIQGEPLDIQSLLYTPEGKPRVSIFYIAHLSEAERMFIVTLLLENMLAWMRALSGTTSLRALMYFDEVFGYFPPHPYNPPSKEPILRLLKQARAFGLGLVLATQNPGDIDYKGLANAGTWFIGKLQTENDKNKVLDGLQTVATVDNQLSIRDVDRLLSTIAPRVFVMHNVHDRVGPVPIHTRWAMSYLRGPLTRQQVRILMADQRDHPYYPTYRQQHPHERTPQPDTLPEPPRPPESTPLPDTLPEMPRDESPASASQPPPRPPEFDPAVPDEASQSERWYQETQRALPDDRTYQSGPQPPARNTGYTLPGRPPQGDGPPLPPDYSDTPPPLSSSIAQFFLSPRRSANRAIGEWVNRTGMRPDDLGDTRLAYMPVLLAQAEVRFNDRKSNVSAVRQFAYQVPDVPRAGLLHWDEHEAAYIDPRELEGPPDRAGVLYGDLAPGMSDSKRLAQLKRGLVDYIYNNTALVIPHNPDLGLYGEPGMSERDFLVQAHQIARQARDDEVDKVVLKYDDRLDRLEARLRRAIHDYRAEQQQAQTLRNEEMFTAGEAALSLLRGRTTYTLSRVSRSRRYRQEAHGQMAQAELVIQETEAELQETQMEMEHELARIDRKWGRIANTVEEYAIKPYKKDIYVTVFGIAWLPQFVITTGGRAAVVPAW